MTVQEMIDYCLAKPHSYLDYPYGDEPAVVRIRAGKRRPGFAQFWNSPAMRNATFRAHPSEAAFFREVYPADIRRGYYCPPSQQPYWNTVLLGEHGECGIPDDELRMMLDHAYEDALSRLPKYVQRELAAERPAALRDQGSLSDMNSGSR